MMYPDGDRLLDQAVSHWRTGQPVPPGQPVIVDRDWTEPPSRQSLEISYRCTGDGRSEGNPAVAAVIDGVAVSLDDPVALEPVPIAKPWGREIWYTGIEARGESLVVTDQGNLPLSSYLAAAPDYLCRRRPIVLLKSLDPRPEPVLGDLYFEVHEVKQEVYVVTHVNQTAWPDGTGAIRFGMNQQLRQSFPDDAAFREAFLSEVQAYESLRQAVDSGDENKLPDERQARLRVEQFSALKPLQVGDVVVVPCWMPHSLQHGVRVVEFQTPTFERHIISFGQKVLSQDGWNSETAIREMLLDAPDEPCFEVVKRSTESIGSFDDFSVWRISLSPGQALDLPANLPYAVAFCVTGRIEISGHTRSLSLDPEQAALIPASAADCRVSNPVTGDASLPAILLIAAPDL